MKLFSLLLILCLMCSCGESIRSRPSEKVKIAREIREKTAEKLKNEMDLIPFGFGGQMLDKIKMLKLVFQYRHPINIKESRKLLIQATSEFLKEVNSNEKIRPYLNNYPFEPKNITIIILLQKPDGSHLDAGKLSLIAAREGIIQYKYDDPNSSKFAKVIEETYEEALQILDCENHLERVALLQS